MDYKEKYIKYKTKYLELKDIDVNNQIGGGGNKMIKPILLVGYAGSGKSTLALQYEKEGYYKIDGD